MKTASLSRSLLLAFCSFVARLAMIVKWEATIKNGKTMEMGVYRL